MSTEMDASPALLRLPAELQLRILSRLPNRAIHNVLLTCKQLYQVALELSVRTFHVPDYVYGAPAEGSPPRRDAYLGFLRYVTITQPGLARHVKELLLGGVWEGPVQVEPDELPVYRDLIAKAFAPGSHPEWKTHRDGWIHDLEEGEPGAITALIVLVCSHVESLCYADSQAESLDRVLLLASRPPPSSPPADGQDNPRRPLAHLRDVCHEGTDEKYGTSSWTDQARLQFQLPRLSSYEVILASGSDQAGELFASLPPRSSPVEHVVLRASAISRGLIGALLKPVRHLRSFEYTRGVYHMYDDEMMPRDLMDALAPHAATLEHLYVNWEDDWYKNGWADNPAERLAMGMGLGDMTALRTLVTGMQALTGLLDAQPEETFGPSLPLEVEGAPRLAQCLPEDLEHLEIHGCGRAILGQAQELLDAVSPQGRYKNLVRVTFAFNAENIEPGEVRLACASPSVELTVLFLTRDNRTYDLSPRIALHGELWVDRVCSRLRAPEFREQWLRLRGRGIASATVNGGVYELPGFKEGPDMTMMREGTE